MSTGGRPGSHAGGPWSLLSLHWPSHSGVSGSFVQDDWSPRNMGGFPLVNWVMILFPSEKKGCRSFAEG